MKGGFDRNKSLQELEGVDWGEPDHPSSLVIACHRLRRKPLDRFTTADLRIMIGQQISLSYLVPLAVERLEEDPLVEASYYRGDLLGVVLRVGESFWATHADSFKRACRIVEGVREILPSLDEIDGPTISKTLAEASDAFEHLKA